MMCGARAAVRRPRRSCPGSAPPRAPSCATAPPAGNRSSTSRSCDVSAPATELVRPETSGFHTLRVAKVERLCEDAVAVTFDVPDELRERYAFRPGQYLTLRRFTGAGEERRSYSICAPAGAPP